MRIRILNTALRIKTVKPYIKNLKATFDYDGRFFYAHYFTITTPTVWCVKCIFA